MSKLYVKSRSRFRKLRTASATIHLPFLTHPHIRLAQLVECAPQLGSLIPFRAESPTHLQGFRPNILVGTCSELRQIAGQVDLGILDLSSVDHAVVALTYCREAPLNDVARVVFWQIFGVPVFEIFAGLDNAILGYECELHEGWHLAPDVHLSDSNGELVLDAPGVIGLQTALSGSLTDDKCPCGRVGLRLLNVEPIRPFEEADLVRQWRASA